MTSLPCRKPYTFLADQRRKLTISLVAIAGLIFLPAIIPAANAQSLNVIHAFTGGADGNYPTAGVSLDRNGNFYGTASSGGLYHHGAVYTFVHKNAGWILTPIYNFKGGMDGAAPLSRVIIGPDGALYGTTQEGGGQGCDIGGCGTVFRLTPPVNPCTGPICFWQETVLYRFTGGSDGGIPETGDLLLDQAGNIYGTTAAGGADGNGVVYELTRSNGSWTESVLHSFAAGDDGAVPYAGVIFDSAGNLYGTTIGGGIQGSGTVYELMKSGSTWTEKTLHEFFEQTEGGNPTAGLVFDSAGNLYGATCCGGDAQGGTAFEMTLASNTWTYNVIYAFPGLGGGSPGPAASLLLYQGSLYGTSEGWIDGNDPGSAFKLTYSNGAWSEDVLHHFTLGNDGGSPYSNLIVDSSGNLYGTTFFGGANGYGTVFQIAP